MMRDGLLGDRFPTPPLRSRLADSRSSENRCRDGRNAGLDGYVAHAAIVGRGARAMQHDR